MFVEDLKNDFYNLLLGNRVLMLVHYDVDAVCACKILQGLFKSDNISYTLVPVGGVSELKRAYEENNEEIKYVVLVNCGGTIDLVDILQPEEDVVFFVLDSHKPTDVCNVYSDGQVRLVYKDSEENIPNFDDIFRDDDDEEEEEAESGREGLEALVERRRERRAWEERRNTLMFNYTQFSYYGKPSAVVCCQLAQLLSRVECVTSWCGCVGAAAAEALCQRSPAAALLDAAELNPLAATGPYHISMCRELALPLYRRWSLWAALRHAPTLAPHLRLHQRAGDHRLRVLLADMGIPLAQAQQSFRSMDVSLRRDAVSACEASCGRAGLPAPARVAAVLRRPHAPPHPALDVVYEIMALLDHESIPKCEGFQLSLAALEVGGEEAASRAGGLAAQRALAAVADCVHRTLSSNQLMLAGPFAYFHIPEGSGVVGAEWLGVAGRWAGAALGGRRAVLVSAARGPACTLRGLPPTQHEPRNLFGAAFEQAAAKSGVSVSLDHMDSSVITLPTSQRAQFLDALTALLA